MKNNLKFILVGFVVFITGIICFNFELKDFDKGLGLISNFNIKREIMSYPINKTKTFRITNDNGNKNIRLYIDNNLSDEIRIIINYLDISELSYEYTVIDNEDNNFASINFNIETMLDFNSVNDIYELGLVTFRDKIIYDYSLFEHPEVKVFINEKYIKNIEFVGSYGQVYNPIG